MVKRLGIMFLGLLLLLTAALAALYHFRLSLAEHKIKQILTAQGYQNVVVNLTALQFDRLDLNRLEARTPSGGNLIIKNLRLTYIYHFPDTISLDTLTLEQLDLPILQKNTRWTIGGWPLGQQKRSGKIDLRSIKIDKINLLARTDYGQWQGQSHLDFDFTKGGTVTAQLNALLILPDGNLLPPLKFDIDLGLESTGQIELRGKINQELHSMGTVLPTSSLNLDIKGNDWRDALESPKNLNLSILIDGKISNAPVNLLPGANIILPLLEESKSEHFSVAVNGALEWRQTRLTPAQDGQALRMTLLTDSGLDVQLSNRDDFQIAANSQELPDQLTFDIVARNGLAKNLKGELIFKDTEGKKHISGFVQAEQWRINNFVIAPFVNEFDLTLSNNRLYGTIKSDSLLQRFQAQNSVLENMPITGLFNLETDFAKGETHISPNNQCTLLGRPYFRLEALSISLKNLRFCQNRTADPLLTILHKAQKPLHLRLTGMLKGQNATIKMGETLITGLPPTVRLTAHLHPDDAQIEAQFSGAKMKINDHILVSGLDAKADIKTSQGTLVMEGLINKARAHDLSQPQLYEDVLFTGKARLNDQMLQFNGDLLTKIDNKTPLSFAGVTGGYDLSKGQGGARLSIEKMDFSPEALQPSDLSPALKGFMENATGSIDGFIAIDFAQEKTTSQASINLNQLTFSGPTRAVTQTAGLNGTIKFSSLFPLISEGEQKVAIDLIDLDALQLEQGTINFELVGDDRLYIRNALWPWFGGELTIANGNIPLNNEKSTVLMRVENIDLGAIVDYINLAGLSATGRISGDMPLIFEQGSARIENGLLQTNGKGVLSYEGEALDRATRSLGSSGELAVDALKRFEFDRLILRINGALDGDIAIGLTMEGNNPALYQGVPIKYAINIEAPISGLIQQFKTATNPASKVIDGLGQKVGVDLVIEESSENP